MSVQAMGWVVKFSPYKGTMFQVHLGIADIVNDTHYNEFWSSVPEFARKIRVSERSCQRALHRMVADGYLTVVRPADPASRTPTTYLFAMPDCAAVYEARSRPTESHRTGDNMAPGLVTPLHQPGDKVAPNPNRIPKKDPKGGTEGRRWRIVPADEQLTEDRIRLGKEAGLNYSRIERQWLRFKNHEFRSPKTDVDRTWQNWCLREADEQGAEVPPTPSAWDERRRAAAKADYEQRLAASRAKARRPSEPTRLGDVLKDVGL